MNKDSFIACTKTGHLCNILYKRKDKRCKRCLKQISEGIIKAKKKKHWKRIVLILDPVTEQKLNKLVHNTGYSKQVIIRHAINRSDIIDYLGL